MDVDLCCFWWEVFGRSFPFVGHVSLFFLWLLLGFFSLLLMFHDLFIMSLCVVVCVCVCLWDLLRFLNLQVIVFIKLESFCHYFFRNFHTASLPLRGTCVLDWVSLSHRSRRLCPCSEPLFFLLLFLQVHWSFLLAHLIIRRAHPVNFLISEIVFYTCSRSIWIFLITSIFLIIIICSFKSLNIFIVAVLKCLPILLCLSFPGVFLVTRPGSHFSLSWLVC